MVSTTTTDAVMLRAIEDELERAVSPEHFPLRDSALYQMLLDMLRYHLGWVDSTGNVARADAGKRLRPLLLLWSCEAVGGEWSRALPAAAAVELVHNFSLVHDDIEDNSVSRRGRLALWQVWGLAHAINTGDAMFVLSRIALGRLDLPPATFKEVQEVFDLATLALTQGQFLDMSFEKRDRVTVDEYLAMVRGKTAALIAASAQIGARLGTGEPGPVRALMEYGENLGIAFQIMDDILGIWGQPEVTGKPAGDDLRARKKTLPVLLAAASDSTGQVSEFLTNAQATEADMQRALQLLAQTGARRLAESEGHRYVQRALAALVQAGPANPGVTRLRNLALQAVQREK